MSSVRNSHPRLLIASAFLTAILAPLAYAVAERESQSASQSPEVKKMRSFAESQHEIVMILIQKKEFTQALSEADKIFALDWPASQEAAIRKDLLFFADQFLHGGQAELGIRLIDTNLRVFRNNANRAAILKEKGYLHKTIGQSDKAIECFREAQRLEKTEK